MTAEASIHPLFAGVYWDVQNVLLEDVERIEVIRGPGGTIWGSNAVNGVINIITKNAKDTHGTYASTSGRKCRSKRKAEFATAARTETILTIEHMPWDLAEVRNSIPVAATMMPGN